MKKSGNPGRPGNGRPGMNPLIKAELTPLTNGCRNDDMIQLGPLFSQSLFQFVQINNAYFVHSSNTRHML